MRCPYSLSALLLLLALAGCAHSGGSRGSEPGDAVSISGYLDGAAGGVGFLDGEAVALAPGARIAGAGAWRGERYGSFEEVALGAEVTVRGVRGADGVVSASEVEVEPNAFTRMDSLVLDRLASGLAVPPPSQLSGGRVEIGGARFRLVEDLEVQTYVTRVGYALVPPHVERGDPDAPGALLFRFYVVEDEAFNAFAFPDGSVFVNTGLLRALENEAQLAAVLGHEIAHAVYEHGRRRFEREQRRRILGRVIEDAAELAGGDRTAAGLFMFGSGVFSNVYGRAEEDQADRVGLHYLVEAGYDPREAVRVWARIAELAESGGGVARDVEAFLYSSHSAASARAEHLQGLVDRYHVGTGGEVGAAAYAGVRSRVGG